MSSGATTERYESPRPIFLCLPSAVRAAIRHGTRLDEINLDRWAQSYPPATPADVEAAWRAEMTKETNSNANGEGK